MFILENIARYPDFLRPDVKINSFFGVFPFCVWDGGRNFINYRQCTKEEILHIKRSYDDFNIPFRFVFTNPEIQPEHLHDRFCNMILREFHEGNNEVVVNSPLLEDYIRTNYPNYKIISSTTKRLNSHQAFLQELEQDKYYQVCLDYDLNKDMDLLNNIPVKERHKVEFLANAICPPNCKYRKQHYSATGKAQLTYLRDGYSVMTRCGISDSSVHPSVLGQGNNLSVEDIDKYAEMGYQYFKLEGRTLPSASVLGFYLYYLINPKYHYLVIEEASMRDGIFINDPNGVFSGEVQKKSGQGFLNILP